MRSFGLWVSKHKRGYNDFQQSKQRRKRRKHKWSHFEEDRDLGSDVVGDFKGATVKVGVIRFHWRQNSPQEVAHTVHADKEQIVPEGHSVSEGIAFDVGGAEHQLAELRIIPAAVAIALGHQRGQEIPWACCQLGVPAKILDLKPVSRGYWLAEHD